MDWQRAYFREQADPRLRKTWPTMAVLMTYADRDLECYPSQATIAKVAGIKDPETVRRHLKLNEDAGWLVKFQSGGPGKGTNHYRFVIPSPLESGGIPATARGPIPAGEQSKLSNRTVHRTVHRSDQNRSPLQSGDEVDQPATETDPWGSGCDLPATERTAQPYPRRIAGTPSSPEERLLAAIRSEGSVGAKSDLGRLMGVSNREITPIIKRMLAEGVIVHDTEREYGGVLVLA